MNNHQQVVFAIVLLIVTTYKLQTIEAFSIHLLRKPFQCHLTKSSSSTVSLRPSSKFYGNTISSTFRSTKNASYLHSFSGNVDRLSNPAKRRFLNNFYNEKSEILFEFDYQDVEEAIDVPSSIKQNDDPSEISTNHDLSTLSSSSSFSNINQGDSMIGDLNTDCGEMSSEKSVSDIPKIVLEELENAVITVLKK